MLTLNELRAQQSELIARVEKIHNTAQQREDTDFTLEELAEIEGWNSEIQALDAEIDAVRQQLQTAAGAIVQRAGTPAAPHSVPQDDSGYQVAGSRVSVGRPRESLAPNGGFDGLGQFAHAVYQACAPGGAVDSRLLPRQASIEGGTTGTGSNVGYAVPDDVSRDIWTGVEQAAQVMPLCDEQTTGSNGVSFPIDANAPWDNSAGIRCYWQNELNQATSSDLALEDKDLKLSTLTALVRVSNEALEDVAFLSGYLASRAPMKIANAVDLALMQGSGVAKPTGVVNAPATVVVPKEASQAADTVEAANVNNMFARMLPSSIERGTWFINSEARAKLEAAYYEGSAGGIYPIYLPPGGLSERPYGILKGRPVVVSEVMNQLGDKGDILFGDFSQYLLLTKAGGIQDETSIHLYFDYNATAFRWVIRIGGAPYAPGPVSRRQTSNTKTLSSFVTLAERA